MVWQDVFPISVSRIDAEEERELRLAAQARAGADWAFAALVARYQPPVTRYLTRLTGNPALARTLAERIFVRMERRVRGPHGGLHLRLWVLRACTEVGLDALRQPQQGRSAARLESPRPAGLLASHDATPAQRTLRAGLDALAHLKGTTRHQVRKLIWYTPDPPGTNEISEDSDSAQSRAPDADAMRTVEEIERMDPREALRYRMVRAVLAELPYGDAQCLALHLVAGLNQAEVAQALGIKHSATRKRIVHGLQLFAQRYEAAAISLGLPTDSLAPTAENFDEAPPALHGQDDIEDYFDIADEPTLDLRRPTVVTGTIAAVSPVIRSEDDDETPEPAAETSHEPEVSDQSRADAAMASEPAHIFPPVEEVIVVPAPPADDEWETPFVVALAAQSVEVDVNPPDPPELAPVESAVLPAPPIPSHADVRRVPVLTAVIDSEREELEQAEQSTPARHAGQGRAVRIVPVLTAPEPALKRAEPLAPTDITDIAEEAGRTANGEHATTMPGSRMAQTGRARLVPVVTPIGNAADQRSAPQNEDLVATTPLRGNSGRHHESGTNGKQNFGRTARDTGDHGLAMAHESRYEPKDTSLAVTARIADDAGADS